MLIQRSSPLALVDSSGGGFGPHTLSLLDCDLSVACQIAQRWIFKHSFLARSFLLKSHRYWCRELFCLLKKPKDMSRHSSVTSVNQSECSLPFEQHRGKNHYWSATSFHIHKSPQGGKTPDVESTMVKKQLARANPPTCL